LKFYVAKTVHKKLSNAGEKQLPFQTALADATKRAAALANSDWTKFHSLPQENPSPRKQRLIIRLPIATESKGI
jgi:hypothetical protein